MAQQEALDAMQYVFKKRFEKKYKKLPEKVRLALDERLRLFAVNPNHVQLNNHALSGKYANHRSINVTGDFRAVFRHITDELVEFIIVDTHSNLYK